MEVDSLLPHAEFGFNDHRDDAPNEKILNGHLVLSNMLSKSNINPFDSQEAKPYKNDPEIIAMTRLRYSFGIFPPPLYHKVGCVFSTSVVTIGNTHPTLELFMSEFLEKHIKITILNNFKEFWEILNSDQQ